MRVRLQSLAGLAGLAGLASLAGLGACSDPAYPAGPDILIVSIDSLRADHLGCYGYERPTSPTIDGLAARGARFDQAVSTTSWTLPAHAALFTGLFDSAHGLVDNGLQLGDAHETLAELMRDAGWMTAGFFGGPYLHPTFGLAQGFTDWQSCMTRLPADVTDAAVRQSSRSERSASHRDVTGPRTAESVERWLADNVDSQGRPFFLFVHLWDVHYDYHPPAEYVELFDPGYEGPITGEDFLLDERIHADMPDADREHLLALYDAEIRFTDEILGRILESLERRGRLANTLVVVLADHGEEFFDHGDKGHQKTLFDEVVRVPLLVSWPGKISEGRAIDDQVRLVDVMPTVLALAGAHAPDVQGRDLSPLLTGGTLPPADALCELLVNGRALRAIRDEESKTTAALPGRYVRYDLRSDPREQDPLEGPAADEGGSRLRALRDDALDWRRAHLGTHAVTRAADDPLVDERLRAAGYAGDGVEPSDD